MKLDKLRGWGSMLAFASPLLALLSLASFIGILAVTHPAPSAKPPVGAILAVGVSVVLLGLAGLSGLAVALDLEWIEHPLTHTGMTYIALAGAAVGTLAFLVTLLMPLANVQNGSLVGAIAFLIAAGWGVYLVVINVVGMRARILGRPLAWLGMLAGACWLATAAFVVVLIGATGFTIIPGLLLYALWSVWLGFRLRGKGPEPAPAPA